MDLRLLRYFIAVAEERHFTRAAQRLNMAQPPLSQQIRALEDELGVQLFLRTKRHVELSEPGRHFLASAREILASVNKAVIQVQRAARGETGQLTIGMVSSAPYENAVALALRRYRERCPAVAITLQEMSSGEQIEALRENRIQLGFVRPPVSGAGMTLFTIVQEPLVAVLPDTHPLAHKKRIELRALSEHPFIMIHPSHGSGIKDLVMSACLRAGFSPRISQEAKEIHTLIGFVAAGFGISLLPSAARKFHHPGVVYPSLAPPKILIEVAAVYRSDAQSQILEGFISVLKESVAQTYGPADSLGGKMSPKPPGDDKD